MISVNMGEKQTFTWLSTASKPIDCFSDNKNQHAKQQINMSGCKMCEKYFKYSFLVFWTEAKILKKCVICILYLYL